MTTQAGSRSPMTPSSSSEEEEPVQSRYVHPSLRKEADRRARDEDVAMKQRGEQDIRAGEDDGRPTQHNGLDERSRGNDGPTQHNEADARVRGGDGSPMEQSEPDVRARGDGLSSYQHNEADARARGEDAPPTQHSEPDARDRRHEVSSNERSEPDLRARGDGGSSQQNEPDVRARKEDGAHTQHDEPDARARREDHPATQHNYPDAQAQGQAPQSQRDMALQEYKEPLAHRSERDERNRLPDTYFHGNLFKDDNTGTDKYRNLMCGLKEIITRQYDPSESSDLMPGQLVKYYEDLNGDYSELFLKTPSPSIAFIYKSLGCSYSLQPKSHAERVEEPEVPALKTEGWIMWSTIQMLLGPDEHAGFLIEAVRRWDITDPETGKLFSKVLPRESLPGRPDERMTHWYEGVSQRLTQEAEEEAKERRRVSNHAETRKMPPRTGDDADSVDSRGPALAYFRNPLYRHGDGRPSIVRRGSGRAKLSPRRSFVDKGKAPAITFDNDRDRRRRSVSDQRYHHPSEPAPPGVPSAERLPGPGQQLSLQQRRDRRTGSISGESESRSSAHGSVTHLRPRDREHALRQSRSHDASAGQREQQDYFQQDAPTRTDGPTEDMPPTIGPSFAPSPGLPFAAAVVAHQYGPDQGRQQRPVSRNDRVQPHLGRQDRDEDQARDGSRRRSRSRHDNGRPGEERPRNRSRLNDGRPPDDHERYDDRPPRDGRHGHSRPPFDGPGGQDRPEDRTRPYNDQQERPDRPKSRGERPPHDDRREPDNRPRYDDRYPPDGRPRHDERREHRDGRHDDRGPVDRRYDQRRPLDRHDEDRGPSDGHHRHHHQRESDNRPRHDDQRATDARPRYNDRYDANDREQHDDRRRPDDRQRGSDRGGPDDRQPYDDRRMQEDRARHEGRREPNHRQPYDDRRMPGNRSDHNDRALPPNDRSPNDRDRYEGSPDPRRLSGQGHLRSDSRRSRGSDMDAYSGAEDDRAANKKQTRFAAEPIAGVSGRTYVDQSPWHG